MNPVISELNDLDLTISPILMKDRAAALNLVAKFSNEFTPEAVNDPKQKEQRIWELVGLFFFNSKRFHEALGVFSGLYNHMNKVQIGTSRPHKGMPLVWMSECFDHLGFPVHSKRYLMLTLCEDSLRDGGSILPNESGVYFRLVWHKGLSDKQVQDYAHQVFNLYNSNQKKAQFPEALLQSLDDAWQTDFPSGFEASSYWVNTSYAQYLLKNLGDGTGESLELLAQYLMSCMPGCRTQRRAPSWSTDYDIVCSMEGPDVDFRSEFGRHFICECKDWNKPADFTAMAKFCRVLDSIKSRFGILFSKNGISGTGGTQNAAREQLKVFQDRGIVIIVLDRSDLEKVAAGSNLITLLRQKYESIRLDLR